MQPFLQQPTTKMPLEEFVVFAGRLGVSSEDAVAHYHNAGEDEVFRNNKYLVIRRDVPPLFNPEGIPGIKWLSIRRLDGKVLREWGDLQRIKNRLLGKEAEAVEVFPAESRKVNAVNQYHLFGGGEWRAPFGFPRRQA